MGRNEMSRDSNAELLKTKNQEDILRGIPLWKGRQITISSLTGGITNRNYLVRSGFASYVARFAFSSNTLLGLDREREVFNTNCAAREGLGPHVVAHMPEHHLLVVRYIDGVVFSKESARDTRHIVAIGKMLRRLHSGESFKGDRNVFRDIEEYIALARLRFSWLPRNTEKYLRNLWCIERKMSEPLRVFPCHFDLMLENIVETHEGVKLIDWEYSANGDRRFDIAMFAMKASLADAQIKMFLDAYNGDEENPVHFSDIQLMKAVSCLREASWGVLQYAISDLKEEVDYKKYTADHLDRFDEMREKVNF